MQSYLLFWVDSLTRSYARIFFAESRWFGAVILAATFVVPAHGLFGLLAALFTNGAARLIGLDRSSIRQGLYGFNGVLTGLGVGFFYEWSPQTLAILAMASLLVLLVRVILDYVLGFYLGLPSMSLPFTLVTWLLLLASIEFGHLAVSFDRLLLFHRVIDFIPSWANDFLGNIGAVLFQVNGLSGLIIGFGLLFYSPTAFVLVAIGLWAGFQLHGFFGIELSLLDRQLLGFNYMLTALALGGIFAAPSAGSLLVALVGVSFAVFFLTAMLHILPAMLTPLAMPFNLAVLLVLYLLKNRSFPSLGVLLVPLRLISTPEDHLAAREQLQVEPVLPFNGSWQVTQGIGGRYTHRDDWAFAYDFMAVNSQGATYKGAGDQREDYYGFGLPVLAPATGKVAALCSHVEDNAIGRENREENWGNYVIIEHGPGLYSCLAHLKKASLSVVAGQRVASGQVVGLCGNSGRSPYPHLHLQLQAQPVVGAPAIPFRFANILLRENEQERFLHRGKIREGLLVRNPTGPPAENLFPAAASLFELKGRTEHWVAKSDPTGTLRLECGSPEARVCYSLSRGVLRFYAFEGSRRSGLYLLTKYLRELPLVGEGSRRWTAHEEVSPARTFRQGLATPLSLLGIGAALRLEYETEYDAAGLTARVCPTMCLTLGSLKLPLPRWALFGGRDQVRVVFRRGRGLERLEKGDFLMERRDG